MLAITARITAQAGKEEELKKKLLHLIEVCKDHEGLLLYSVHQHKENPRNFIFYEQFANEAAFQAHLDSPELKEQDALPQSLMEEIHIDQWTRLAVSGSHCLSALDAIATRRSIRSFTAEPLDETIVRQIIEAGMQAPSAGNAQPWEFVVLRSAESKQKVVDMHPYAKMAAQAPVAVLVCGNLSKEKYPGFWVQDCSAALQSMLVAARAQGVGTVWCGIHPMQDRVEAFRAAFGLPAHVEPLGLVVMGWPDQPFTQRDVFDASKIHHEQF